MRNSSTMRMRIRVGDDCSSHSSHRSKRLKIKDYLVCRESLLFIVSFVLSHSPNDERLTQRRSFVLSSQLLDLPYPRRGGE